MNTIKLKYKIIIMAICFFVCSTLPSLKAFNDIEYVIYEKVMARVDRHLKAAEGEAKGRLLSKPIHIPYLRKLKVTDDIDDNRLFSVDPEKPEESTHALALAICAADQKRVASFLDFVADPKDPSWRVWGFRQYFNMAHVALDPAFPTVLNIDEKVRLDVVKLIGTAGFDFNYLGDGTYTNPPLAAGFVSEKPVKGFMERQALALLLGADPNIVGSGFDAVMSTKVNLSKCLKLAYEMRDRKEVEQLKLSKYVREEFERLDARKGANK